MKRLMIAATALVAALAAAVGGRAQAADLHNTDMRLLAVAFRIQAANAGLCDRLEPALGVALQSTDQFPRGEDPGFASPVAFALVLPGGPADRAGITANEGLVSIAGRPVAKTSGLSTMPLRDSAHAMLSDISVPGTVQLGVTRGDGVREIRLEAPAACRALVEILAGAGTAARSDGRVIQIGEGLANRASDEELAVIFAHELAHSVLHHRDRLSALGVDKGFGGEFGRDRQLNGEAEIEADRLSVHLLANAGYDPRVAPTFWRGPLGKSISGGLFRSRIYSSADGRAALLDREIADYLFAGGPSWPGHLLARRARSG